MKKLPIKKVISDLQDIFDVKNEENNSTGTDKGTFAIDKNHMSRLRVIAKLQEYFLDKTIDGGFLKVANITFVFTTFQIIKRDPLTHKPIAKQKEKA